MTLLDVRRGDLREARADAVVLPAATELPEAALTVVEPEDASRPLRLKAVAPVWHGGQRDEAKRLADLHTRIVEAAVAHGARTLAVPCLGTGGAGVPAAIAASAAVAGAQAALLGKWFDYRTPLRILRWWALDDAVHDAFRAAIDADAYPKLKTVRARPGAAAGGEPTSATRPLPFERRLSPDDVDLVRAGLAATQMEERWIVRTDGDRVRFLRSWTGYEIFTLRLRPRPDGAPGGILDQLQRCDDPERFDLPDALALRELESVLERTLRLR